MVRPTDKETVATEKLVPYPHLPKVGSVSCRTLGEGTKVSQEAERARGKKWSRTFIVISIVKERKGRVNGLRICYFE